MAPLADRFFDPLPWRPALGVWHGGNAVETGRRRRGVADDRPGRQAVVGTSGRYPFDTASFRLP